MKRIAIVVSSSTLGLINWLLDRDCWPTLVYNQLLDIHCRIGRIYLRLAHPLYYHRLVRIENEGFVADLEPPTTFPSLEEKHEAPV